MAEYRVARIVNTFGIKGEIKIISDTDFPEERFAIGNQLIVMKENKVLTQVTIASARIQKGTYILKFKEFDNINQVEEFKGGYLAISDEQQQDLEDDAYYYHQIIGLEVVTLDGKFLGTIKDILELGSNDVWVVQRPDRNKSDALIPYIDDVVKEVNLAQGRVIVELMDGLIDDED